MEIYVNVSQTVRQIDAEEKAIYRDIGDALAKNIWAEFEILVAETAQYTGTTAASWNLSMGGDTDVREQPARTKANALSVGHGDAVRIALDYNLKKDALSQIADPKVYSRAAIVVENNAPGAEVSEHGPLRAENAGAAGALARFENRIAFANFEVIRDRYI